LGFYADGQICAVEWTYNSITVRTGYIYDAEGNRVAKGAITTMSCDPSANGFTTQADYVRDQAGHQLSEFVPGHYRRRLFCLIRLENTKGPRNPPLGGFCRAIFGVSGYIKDARELRAVAAEHKAAGNIQGCADSSLPHPFIFRVRVHPFRG